MINQMDYTKKSIPELKALCKERKIKGISGKSKTDLIAMLEPPTNVLVNTEAVTTAALNNLRQDVIHGDTIQILPTLASDSAQIIIADPPYNIGKDFGNDSDKQPMDAYLIWCEKWIKE